MFAHNFSKFIEGGNSSKLSNHGRVALCAAMLVAGAGTAYAERITPADLLDGELPSTTVVVDGGSVSGIQSGGVADILAESDARSVQFALSKMESEGCMADFTLNYSFANGYFNTYAVRVAKSSPYYSVARAPKKWEIWGKTNEEGAEWELLSTEENQTGWQFADNGGDTTAYAQEQSPGETRYYHFNCNHRAYKYLRFKFLENNGDSQYMFVTRLILYRPCTLATGATAETFAECSDLVPAATSETAYRYTTTTHAASGSFGAGNPRVPFSDADPARVVMKLTASPTADLIYEFGADDKKIVNGYMVRFTDHEYTNMTRAPYAWTFSGSDDKVNWTPLDVRDEQVWWTKGEKRFYAFENHTSYAFYRIEFTNNNGASDFYEVGNIDYYYLPIEDDVFFKSPETSLSDGTLTLSGGLWQDSLAADVSYSVITNGIRFTIDCGTVQPGGAFSASIPFSAGTISWTLTGVSTGGVHTKSVASDLAYISGEEAVRFVSPNGDDENAGTSLESPMRRIATAVASLGAVGGSVYVLPGAYSETNDISAVELTAPVKVIGVSGNPVDVVVTKSATYARIFKLDNASALVRAVTMQNGNVQNEPKEGYTVAEANSPANSPNGIAVNGGNLWITANGGVVENCNVRYGTVRRYNQAGGNVFMQGGRLSRCVLKGGTLIGTHNITQGDCGTSLLANGGVVESCLMTGTTQHLAPVSIGGSAKLINCTIAGNSGTDCGGVVIKGNNSRVVNTVIFGGSTTNGEYTVYRPSPRNGNVPADVTAAFVNCATDGGVAINSTCLLVGSAAFVDAANGDYSPASKESPIVNKGADYAANGGVSEVDLVGNVRVWTSLVDIGAYEFNYELSKGLVVIIR